MLENELILANESNKTKSSKYKKYELKEKEDYYRRWQLSGQSKRRFCQENDLPISNFHKWVMKLESKKVCVQSEPKAFTWQSIKIEKASVKSSELIELHLPSGHYFRLPISLELSWLKRLIQEVL